MLPTSPRGANRKIFIHCIVQTPAVDREALTQMCSLNVWVYCAVHTVALMNALRNQEAGDSLVLDIRLLLVRDVENNAISSLEAAQRICVGAAVCIVSTAVIREIWLVTSRTAPSPALRLHSALCGGAAVCTATISAAG